VKMKYPLDQKAFGDLLLHLVEHDKALRTQKAEEPSSIVHLSEEEIYELSEEEIASQFGGKKLRHLSEDEINGVPIPKLERLVKEYEEEEAKAEASIDIYKIKARVANLARGPGVSLTPQGEQLCNVFVHVLKSLYEFASKIEDQHIRSDLNKLIRSHEGMPGTLIAAAGAGVKQANKDEI
jgi:hypothetical protein